MALKTQKVLKNLKTPKASRTPMALKTLKTQSKKKKVYCGICSDWEIKRPEKCSNTMIHKGTKFYFCTSKCKDRFSKSPEKFL